MKAQNLDCFFQNPNALDVYIKSLLACSIKKYFTALTCKQESNAYFSSSLQACCNKPQNAQQ